MLTRITRYTLLVLCLLVAGVWGWSATHMSGVAYREYSVVVHWGRLTLGFTPINSSIGLRPLINPYKYKTDYGLVRQFEPFRSGWINIDDDNNATIRAYRIWIPFGWLLLPILMGTIAMWYRPIRNRLRGKRDTGFEVEAKAPSP
ncbi:MAG: hypothetical protein H7144_12880 [Burkholderiales bacterium]|nr:hypothetical protein [Phycisphaerae bacterium]